VAEAIDQLGKEHGIKADYLRLRAYPFSQDVHDFIRNHDVVYVVEQNRDGQMHELLKLDAAPEQVTKLRRVLHYNGLPMDARSVSDEIVRQEAK
jgi:2-oxoglutarate ferredoxin oxidoreductase subunit alpha